MNQERVLRQSLCPRGAGREAGATGRAEGGGRAGASGSRVPRVGVAEERAALFRGVCPVAFWNKRSRAAGPQADAAEDTVLRGPRAAG